MYKKVKDKIVFNSFSILLVVLFSIPYIVVRLNSPTEKNEYTAVSEANILKEAENVDEKNHIEDYKLAAYSLAELSSMK